MKRVLAIVFLSIFGLFAYSQPVTFQTNGLRLGINERGFVDELSICETNIITANTYPILIGCRNGEITFPTQFVSLNDNSFKVQFDDGGYATIAILSLENHLKISIIEQSSYTSLVFCPMQIAWKDHVGEIIGVAQGKGKAFGILALNSKVNAGLPSEYAEFIKGSLDYKGNEEVAAIATKTGTRFQFTARDRSQTQWRKVQGIENVMVLPVKGIEGRLEEAAVALFGCAQDEIMDRIDEIELVEHLPHPIHDGLWNKTNPYSSKSYIICDYAEKDADLVKRKCRQASLDWSCSVLTNRIPTNSKLVTPNPSEHLLKQGVLHLQLPLKEDQTDFAVYHSDLFVVPANLNILQIDEELVTYRSTEATKNNHLFYSCKRGAFGTKKTAHDTNATVYKLWDTPDRALLPDLETQNQMARTEAKKLAKTDYSALIFNDLNSYTYNGHGDLALGQFLDTMFLHNPDKLLQADLLTHWAWHSLSRINDNTLWNESMRTKIVETLTAKQQFYRRNLFPWMIGNFQIHLADNNRKATTLEELEWFLSKAAAFDAGFGLDFNVETMGKHGLTDTMLNTVSIWESLRLTGTFNEKQKETFKDPYGNWHLEKANDSSYLLYSQHISRRYFCNYENDTWEWNSPFKSRFALRISVEGKGSIDELNFRTPNGILYLPCTLQAGQFLIYNFDGTAYITDQNYNKIEEVVPQGVAILDEGTSEVNFRCEVKTGNKKIPHVTVRYITRSKPETIILVP